MVTTHTTTVVIGTTLTDMINATDDGVLVKSNVHDGVLVNSNDATDDGVLFNSNTDEGVLVNSNNNNSQLQQW